MEEVTQFKVRPAEEYRLDVVYDICPICKRTVKINRHNKALCEEICRRQNKIGKTAQDAIEKTN